MEWQGSSELEDIVLFGPAELTFTDNRHHPSRNSSGTFLGVIERYSLNLISAT